MVLPEDVLVLILCHSHPYDVLRYRIVSRILNELTRLHIVWSTFLNNYIVRQHIPIPYLRSRTISSLSVQELEFVVIRAMQLRHNWTSSSPVCKSEETLSAVENSSQGFRVVGLHFVLGTFLVSVATSQPGRKLQLRCWNIHPDVPEVDVVASLSTDAVGWGVNSGDSLEYLIALLYDSEVHILGLDPENGGNLAVNSTIPIMDTAKIHAIRQSTILTESRAGVLSVWDIHHPDNKFTLKGSQVPTQPNTLLDSLIEDRFIVLARTKSIHLYSLEALRSQESSTELSPAMSEIWQWNIDTVCLSPRITGGLSVLLRWSTQYPWPINMLHHYIFPRNEAYNPGDALTPNNIPFGFPPPVLNMTLGSPVRLLSHYSMTVGKYGTALWTDSHTEDYFHHSHSGQRLVGTLLADPGSEDDGSGDGGRIRQEIDPNHVSGEVEMVFDVQEADSWIKVGVDDVEGRIAVALDNGDILLRRYI